MTITRTAPVVLLFFSSIAVHSQNFVEYFDSDRNTVDQASCETSRHTYNIDDRIDSVVSKNCKTGLPYFIYKKDKNGQFTGAYHRFHTNGRLKYTTTFERGIASDSISTYYASGSKKYVQYPVKDNPDLIVHYWAPDGKQIVKDGAGKCECVFDGEFTSDILETGQVVEGLRDSVWIGSSVKDGGILFTEKYERGELIEGESYRKGDTLNYKKIEEPATPLGGTAAFYSAIYEIIRYPKTARKMEVEGRVFVEFIVEENGSISNVHVIKGIGGGCDEEAVRVLSTVNVRWDPGKQRGIPVRQKMVLPIGFKLGK